MAQIYDIFTDKDSELIEFCLVNKHLRLKKIINSIKKYTGNIFPFHDIYKKYAHFLLFSVIHEKILLSSECFIKCYVLFSFSFFGTNALSFLDKINQL